MPKQSGLPMPPQIILQSKHYQKHFSFEPYGFAKWTFKTNDNQYFEILSDWKKAHCEAKKHFANYTYIYVHSVEFPEKSQSRYHIDKTTITA